jgi:GT2 family glycosyltransferase
LIAIPHSGSVVGIEWAINFAGIWKRTPVNTKLLLMPEPQIDVARDKAVEISLQLGAKHLLFLDSDVHPPKDVIAKLLAHKLPIVSALYARRQNPPWNQMLRRAPDGFKFTPIEEGTYEAGSLVECDAVGFGCILIETRVFKIIERPWFRWTEYYAIGGISEDFNFCAKAKQAGFKITVDTSIICKHSGFIKWLPSKGMNMFEYSQVSGVFD